VVLTGNPLIMSPFTQTALQGTPAAGLSLITVPLTAANRSFERIDNLSLQIDTTPLALAQLSAQNYTGTLTIQAQAL